MYPLKLKYYAKTALWGGNTLKAEWNKPCDLEKLAETWELTVRPEAANTILNGDRAGQTLGQYLAEHPSAIGKKNKENGFPLLIKFIDACDNLSVQVHPDDNYAHRVENDRGKTEMWYIAAATEDAKIIYGLRNEMTAEDFRQAFEEQRIFDAIKTVSVKAGETYFIPSGMLHAIGAGCLIAEIQQNSDLTYRVYDYDRIGADGKPRELHVKKSLDVIRPFAEAEINAIRYSHSPRLEIGECLAACPYFEVHRLTVRELPMAIHVTDEAFHHLLCVDGEGEIIHEGIAYPIARGDSFFLPAGMGKYSLSGAATILLSTV